MRHRRRSTAEQRGVSRGRPIRSSSSVRSPHEGSSPLTVGKSASDNVSVESPPLADNLVHCSDSCSDSSTPANLGGDVVHADAYRERKPSVGPTKGNSGDIGEISAGNCGRDCSSAVLTVGQDREQKRDSWSGRNTTTTLSPGSSVGVSARNKRSRVAITSDDGDEPEVAQKQVGMMGDASGHAEHKVRAQ